VRSKRSIAASLFAAGTSRAEVARRLRIARSTAGEWYRRWASRGEIAVRARGPAPRLSATDLERLSEAMLRPPRAEGFDLDRWTLAAIAAWLERETRVAHHRRHVGRVLARAGFVIPPVGRNARCAMRARSTVDPDGNELRLYRRQSRAERSPR